MGESPEGGRAGAVDMDDQHEEQHPEEGDDGRYSGGCGRNVYAA